MIALPPTAPEVAGGYPRLSILLTASSPTRFSQPSRLQLRPSMHVLLLLLLKILVGTPQFEERAVPNEVERRGKHRQDEPNGTEDHPQLSGIEQLIQGKTFTRDEINRLMEILSSVVSDVSDFEEGKSKEVLTSVGANVGAVITPFSKAAYEGHWKTLNKVVITSPKPDTQIAFMGSRLSEYGPGPSGVSSKRESAQNIADEFA